MKKQIRLGVFETNSSSTHSLVILNEDEFSQYKHGKLHISSHGNIMLDDEFKAFIEDEKNDAQERYNNLNNDFREKYYPTFEKYWESKLNDLNYDYDERRMEIEEATREIDGVKVHALSIYGYED